VSRFGLKEERKRAAGEEEMSLMERGEEKSSNACESEKDLGWNESWKKSGLGKGWGFTKRPMPVRDLSLQGGSGSGEMGLERDASGRPRAGSELTKT